MKSLLHRIMKNKFLATCFMILLAAAVIIGITAGIKLFLTSSDLATASDKSDLLTEESNIKLDSVTKSPEEVGADPVKVEPGGPITSDIEPSQTKDISSTTSTDLLPTPAFDVTPTPASDTAAYLTTGQFITTTTSSVPETDTFGADYELYSLDFVDALNGWVVLQRTNNIGVNNKVSLLHTRDGGVSWEAYEYHGCLLQQVSFADSENGWALALEGDPLLSTGDSVTYQLLRTEDGGKSWTPQMSMEAVYGDSNEIKAYSANNACTVIAGIIYHTENMGASWSVSESPVKDFYAEHIFFNAQGFGWVSGVTRTALTQEQKSANPDYLDQPDNYNLYVFITEDGAISWKQQFYEYCGNEWNKTLGISFADEENGWFLTCNYGTFDGELFHTTDGGREWEKVNQMRVCRPYAMGIEAVTPKTLWIPFHHGAGPIDGGLYYSGDGGTSFEFLGTEAEILNSNAVDFVTSQLGFAILSGYPDKSLMMTTDGGKTWDKVRFADK